MEMKEPKHESSNVRSVGWADGRLEVMFKNGTRYGFGDEKHPVPFAHYTGILTAKSPGGYFSANVKNKFPYRQFQ